MIKKIGLIKGRHALPPEVKHYFFTRALTSEEMTDGRWLLYAAENALLRLDVKDEVIIYVTGLTAALIAVLNACRARGIKVWLMHYDRVRKSWWTQEVM